MPSSHKLKILFLGANPKNTTRLRIDEELREIDQQLRLSTARERLSLAQGWAIRADDLQQALIDNEPQIVHFSGHGDVEGILIEDEQGNAHQISTDAVSELFGLFKESVKCVLLNACFSETQAKAILAHIPYVIGMRSEMPDAAAIKFSVGFYKAIAAGKTVEFAFSLGVNAIKLEGIDATLVPQLMKSQNDLQLLPEAETAILAQQHTKNTENITKNVLWKWVGASIGGAVLAGIIGFFVAKNLPEHELAYRIGDAKVDLYKNTKDSLLMTFELICDNNTPKNLQFVRDSVTLSFDGIDKTFKSFHNGAAIIQIDKKENKTVSVYFVTPMLFKPLSILIAQKHGKARVDYGFGNLAATSTVPIASNDLDSDDASKPAPMTIQTEDTAVIPIQPKTTPEKTTGGKTRSKITPQPPLPIKKTAVLPTVKTEPKPIPAVNPTETVAITGGDIKVSSAVVAIMQRQIKAEKVEEKIVEPPVINIEKTVPKSKLENAKINALKKIQPSPVLRKRTQ